MTTPRPAGSQVSLPAQTPRSLDQQRVLDEDEYTEALSHIIARDFFPSLVHLDATNEYLDSVQSKDPSLIAKSVRRLESLSTPSTRRRGPQQTPSQTPYGVGPSDTPMPYHTPRTAEGEAPAKRPRYDTDMSLDAFQAKYTSEDNASFTQILADENKQRQEKYGWAWDAQRRAEAMRSKALESRERMMIEAPADSAPGVKQKLVIEPPAPLAGLITAGGEDDEEEARKDEIVEELKEEREVAVVLAEADDDVEQSRALVKKDNVVDVLARKKDTRPAGVDGWKFKTRNSLMFTPDADTNPHDHKPTPEGTVPKEIKYGNTRLIEHDTRSSRGGSEPPSPTRSRIDAAIAGAPYRPSSPKINDYSLVDAMPSPTPSELGPAAVKQLMTWGTLNATPRVLQPADDIDSAVVVTPNTPFHLPSPTAREALSHRLSNRAAKSIRERASLLNGTPRTNVAATPRGSALGRAVRKNDMAPPSSTLGPGQSTALPAGGLTPAAKRLLDRTTMGSAAARRAEVMERNAAWEKGKAASSRDMNKVRWTPSPSPVTRRGE